MEGALSVRYTVSTGWKMEGDVSVRYKYRVEDGGRGREREGV